MSLPSAVATISSLPNAAHRMSANSRTSSRCSMARAKGAGGCDWTRSRLGLKSCGSTPTIRGLRAPLLAADIGGSPRDYLYRCHLVAVRCVCRTGFAPYRLRCNPTRMPTVDQYAKRPISSDMPLCAALDGSWDMALDDSTAPQFSSRLLGNSQAQRRRMLGAHKKVANHPSP